MRAFVFTDPALTSRAGQFVWLELNVDDERNAAHRERLSLEVMPTFLVVSPADESVIMRREDGMTVAEESTAFPGVSQPVNMGGLGFLTATTVDEAYPLLERILKGDFVVEERMMLSVGLKRDGRAASTHKVLNDVVIKASDGRLVRLETRINREYVNTYRADGLIIATPTGSTAYSLSANGPILYPTIHSIRVAPICPFNLTNRPVVIPDWMTVDVTLIPDRMSVGLILDGQVDVGLEAGDVVEIRRAEASVYLVKYEGKSYFDILRERLMWEVKTPAGEPGRR